MCSICRLSSGIEVIGGLYKFWVAVSKSGLKCISATGDGCDGREPGGLKGELWFER
jgi:hypothetical protein